MAYTHGGNPTNARRARKGDIKASADAIRDAWLRDHPGKTLADCEAQSQTEFSEWLMALMKPQQGKRR